MARRTMRAGQLVSPFGVGAVIDLGTECFTCVDVTSWPRGECPVVPDNPLREVLRADVRTPPAGDRPGSIPLSRFPRWLFCPSCERLHFRTRAEDVASDGDEPKCRQATCRGAALIAMRFIGACDQGHLQDVDWFRWAHRNAQAATSGQCSRQTAELYFHTTGASGGDFNAMIVRCEACGASNTFEDLTSKPYPFGCNGRQPWQDAHTPSCRAPVWVYPRAASNVYYPQTRSAIDLDARSAGPSAGQTEAFLTWAAANGTVSTLRAMKGMFEVGVPQALYLGVAQEAVRAFGISEEEALAGIAAAIDSDLPAGGTQGAGVTDSDHTQQAILRREWPYLARPTGVQSRHLRTSVVPLRDRWPQHYADLFEQVTLVERLREVRALIGFRRVRPDGIQVAVDLGQGADWLPGVEAFGEGVFLKLRESTVAAWESTVAPAYSARSTYLSEACERWGRTPVALHSSPRFVALHTFSHALVRRLAFDAGYSSASIRERIYCDLAPTGAAGVLLYTADGDSEGSLGGLVRQGEADRLIVTVQRTIADLAWCSADPVCSEMEAQGVDGLNAAACHACCLVSETSCGYNNSLLDRRLLIGGLAIPGLFEPLLEALDRT